ncbi:hypothetical protein [Paenibacillus alkalitolerans]|uniref:hypothetical protein n=1 Tax=Paenibacillus alkalitolerans TaxID=2799335 RepID=UPI0018F4BC8D|nr:hypothetical protein [Paenibacillus alkalitolerans]
MGVLLFSKDELVEFLIKRIKEEEPAVSFEPGEEGDMLYTVRFADQEDAKAIMNFDNIWTAYQRTNDINCVIEGLNAQLKALRMSHRLKEDWQGFREEHVYPVLRPKRYATRQPGGGTMLYDTTADGMDTLFMERRDGLCLFLNKEMVPEGQRNRWKRIAYDNVRKMGWVPPKESFPALNYWEGGRMHVFYDAGHPFQLQFFLRDMAEKGMSSSFLVGFPSYDMAIALTVDAGIATAKSAKDIALRSGLAKFTHVMYFQEPRPLSVNVYWVNGGKYTCVFRQPEPKEGKAG